MPECAAAMLQPERDKPMIEATPESSATIAGSSSPDVETSGIAGPWTGWAELENDPVHCQLSNCLTGC
jgi:hypothetical protein